VESFSAFSKNDGGPSILRSTPLLALAIAAFGIGTSEFIIMGLLPNLADDFRVSIPIAGVLVTGYALSVTIGAPLVAIATSRLERKFALLLLMGIFTLGNLACALWLRGTRFVATMLPIPKNAPWQSAVSTRAAKSRL
jgi:MFS family permease